MPPSELERNPVVVLPLPWERGSSVTWLDTGDLVGTGVELLVDEPLEVWASLLAITEEARRLGEEIQEARALLQSLEDVEGEEEPEPEVLDLQPLSRRSITLEITRRGPAKFYLVDSDSELETLD